MPRPRRRRRGTSDWAGWRAWRHGIRQPAGLVDPADHAPLGRPREYGFTADGRVQVTCWCERALVLVPVERMWAGDTEVCGRPRCRRPTPKAA